MRLDHVLEVVDVGDLGPALHLGDPLFGQGRRLVLEVDGEVELLGQAGRVARVLVVLVGRLLALAGDDQRRAGLVDEDRVDLVHDRVVELPLHALREVLGHVVAEVVEAELVVGPVGDVGLVRLGAGDGPEVLQPRVRVLFVEVLGVVEEGARFLDVAAVVADLVLDHRHRQSEHVEDGAHPAGVAAGEVVVDGDEVGALAAQSIEVERKAGDQRLAFTGLHLGDPPGVEDDAADHLHVEVPEPDGAPRRLPGQREGLDQKRVEVLFLGPQPERVGTCAKAGVVELFQLRLELGDGLGRREVLLDLPLVGVEQPGEERRHGGFCQSLLR